MAEQPRLSEFEDLIRELVRTEPKVIQEIHQHFSDVVLASFHLDRATRTDAEIRRRLNICARWFNVFRKDLKWSRQRAFDGLAEALRCSLDGIKYQPPREDRNTWGTRGENNVIWMPR